MCCTCVTVLHMAMIQVRNVPQDLHRELKARAARAGMSLSDYLLKEIERVAARPPIEEILERARQRGAGFEWPETAAEGVRAERDARR